MHDCRSIACYQILRAQYRVVRVLRICIPKTPRRAAFLSRFSSSDSFIESSKGSKIQNEMSGQRSSSGGGAATSVAAGCALREVAQRPSSSMRLINDDGLAVFSWGRGEDGQLGLGDTRYVCRCRCRGVPQVLLHLRREKSGSPRMQHWGKPAPNPLSLTHFVMRCILFYTSDQDEPTYVDALRGVMVRQIACGSGHTVVLTIEGEVYTWGRGKVVPALVFR